MSQSGEVLFTENGIDVFTENGLDLFTEKRPNPIDVWYSHENKKDAGRPYESFPGSSAPRSVLRPNREETVFQKTPTCPGVQELRAGLPPDPVGLGGRGGALANPPSGDLKWSNSRLLNQMN